LLCQSVCH